MRNTEGCWEEGGFLRRGGGRRGRRERRGMWGWTQKKGRGLLIEKYSGEYLYVLEFQSFARVLKQRE